MAVRLYTVPASHPSAAAERALQLKGADYERIDLITVAAQADPARRASAAGACRRRSSRTATKVLGSRGIMRALDERYPGSAALPGRRRTRARTCERAEQWGEEVLQPLARRVTWAALRRAPHAMRSYLDGREAAAAPRAWRCSARRWSCASPCASTAPATRTCAPTSMHLDSHLAARRRLDRRRRARRRAGQRGRPADRRRASA